jgi:hypothetical protein
MLKDTSQIDLVVSLNQITRQRTGDYFTIDGKKRLNIEGERSPDRQYLRSV